MVDAVGPSRFTFVSSNDVWGGSEELWSGTALALARRGHRITVVKPRIDPHHPAMIALAAAGCRLIDMFGSRRIPRKLRTALLLYWPVARRWIGGRLAAGLTPRPDLVVISQGINFDGHVAAEACRRRDIPYVLISQKAADMYWPPDGDRPKLRAMHRDARATLFVSHSNLRLTEEQLGCTLANASVVRNPFKADWAARNDWPDEGGPYRFVCLARLDTREKGQDLLLRVLALPKWRDRDIEVRFVGDGHNAEGLRDLARLLELVNIAFDGFTSRPDALWRACHGLILPSHCEGLPLSLVEAMLSGRVAIVTAVGGAAEVIRDGETGFLAAAATVDHLDAAMENAWARRAEWRAIGDAAASAIRDLVPRDPAETLAAMLLSYLASDTGGGRRLTSSIMSGACSTARRRMRSTSAGAGRRRSRIQ